MSADRELAIEFADRASTSDVNGGFGDVVSTPNPAPAKRDLKKYGRYVVISGIALAVICRLLPSNYQALCLAIAELCLGVIP